MAKNTKSTIEKLGLIIGPCCSFDANRPEGSLGVKWCDLQRSRDENRKLVLKRANLEISLENLYNKGLIYGKDKFGNDVLVSTYDPILAEINRIERKKKK